MRSVGEYGIITEATYLEDMKHGLMFIWCDTHYTAFVAKIFEHGVMKAEISWKDDWSEYEIYGSKNK